MKTPLNALAIHLEVLRNKVNGDDDDDAQSQRSLTALDSSIRQVDRLVRDFTDYSAPVAMERKPIDVAQVLHTSLEAIGSACQAKKINLIKELAAGPWQVSGDASRLRQTFDNLLRNAMEAQPDGGEVMVTAKAEGAQLLIDISDAGPGVPPEQRAEIFEFGKTTKATGSGIGLPLSQLIVESHGGSLVVPGAQRQRRDLSRAITHGGSFLNGSSTSHDSRRRRRRSDPPGSEPHCSRVGGIKPAKPLTARPHWQPATKSLPQAIVTDLMMPGMNGLEFVAALGATRAADRDYLRHRSGQPSTPRCKRSSSEPTIICRNH